MLSRYDAFVYSFLSCKQGLVPQPNSAVIYPFGRTHSYYATAAANFAFIDLDRSTATVTELFRNTCNGNPSCELLGLTSGSYEAVSEFVDFFNGEESQQVTVGKECSSCTASHQNMFLLVRCATASSYLRYLIGFWVCACVRTCVHACVHAHACVWW